MSSVRPTPSSGSYLRYCMGDRARQGAVERAACGCLVATLLLTAVLVTPPVVLGPTPLLGGLLVAGGIGLAAVGWAVRR